MGGGTGGGARRGSTGGAGRGSSGRITIASRLELGSAGRDVCDGARGSADEDEGRGYDGSRIAAAGISCLRGDANPGAVVVSEGMCGTAEGLLGIAGWVAASGTTGTHGGGPLTCVSQEVSPAHGGGSVGGGHCAPAGGVTAAGGGNGTFGGADGQPGAGVVGRIGESGTFGGADGQAGTGVALGWSEGIAGTGGVPDCEGEGTDPQGVGEVVVPHGVVGAVLLPHGVGEVGLPHGGAEGSADAGGGAVSLGGLGGVGT